MNHYRVYFEEDEPEEFDAKTDEAAIRIAHSYDRTLNTWAECPYHMELKPTRLYRLNEWGEEDEKIF